MYQGLSDIVKNQSYLQVSDQDLDVWENSSASVSDALRHYYYQYLSSTTEAAEVNLEAACAIITQPLFSKHMIYEFMTLCLHCKRQVIIIIFFFWG